VYDAVFTFRLLEFVNLGRFVWRISSKLTLLWRGFGAEVEDPARDETAENGNVGDNDSDVVFNVADAVINGIGPVRVVDGVEPVAVGKVDFGGTDCGNSGIESVNVHGSNV
jgi:hypothetical protein